MSSEFTFVLPGREAPRRLRPRVHVLASIAFAARSGLRVSLNDLTHPGVTDERAEVEAMEAHDQYRSGNLFGAVGRPVETLGMRAALARFGRLGVVGNSTHPH